MDRRNWILKDPDEWRQGGSQICVLCRSWGALLNAVRSDPQNLVVQTPKQAKYSCSPEIFGDSPPPLHLYLGARVGTGAAVCTQEVLTGAKDLGFVFGVGRLRASPLCSSAQGSFLLGAQEHPWWRSEYCNQQGKCLQSWPLPHA